MTTATVDWKAILTTCSKKDFHSAVDGVVHMLDKQIRLDPRMLDGQGLAQGITASLRSKEPQQVLVGCVVLLVVFESTLPLEALEPLSEEALRNGLSSALTSGTPIIVAAAVRSLCALTAAFPALPMREVVQLLGIAADAHPQSYLVQEAVAQGCCMIVAEDRSLQADCAGAVWSILWRLSLHEREQIARAAVTGLCCLVGAPAAGQSSAIRWGQESIPDITEALALACSEFSQCFRLWDPALTADTEKDPVKIDAHCARLLDLIHSVVVFGQCATQHHSTQEVAILHISKLVSVVEQVFRASFPDPAHHSVNAGESLEEQEKQIAAQTLTSTLALAAALVESSGTMILPHAISIRRWLKMLFLAPLALRDRFSWSIHRFFMRIADSAPAILISAPLLQHLAESSLAAVRAIGAPTPRTKEQEYNAGSQTHSKRKRKSADTSMASADKKCAKQFKHGDRQDSAKVAFSMLAKILTLSTPLLPSHITEPLCIQIVQILWLGVMAPLPLNTKHADDIAIASSDAHMAAACRRLCRDTVAALSLLDVVDALHQHPRLGTSPIAPNLVDAFAVLLVALAMVHHRRAPKQTASCDTSSWRDFNDRSVRLRCLSLRDALLSRSRRAAPCTAKQFNGETASSTNVAISWPDRISVEEQVEGSPAPHVQAPVEQLQGQLALEQNNTSPHSLQEKLTMEAVATPPSIDMIQHVSQQAEDVLSAKTQVPAKEVEREGDASNLDRLESKPLPESFQGDFGNAFETIGRPDHSTTVSAQQSENALGKASTRHDVRHDDMNRAPSSNVRGLSGSPEMPMPAVQTPAIDLEDDALLANILPDIYAGDVDDASPIPELCMDSPDSDEID